ncbi:MAG: diguanylate cyclase [Halanaerobiales bacterium]|nr:diguanylate cyclase [Halanaerobiales bacterium]
MVSSLSYDRLASMRDPLTGLYNRTYFDQEIKRLEEEKCNPVGIIICDIVSLKMFNNALGKESGDKLLLTTAKILTQTFGKNYIIARIGGDEFAVILPKISQKNTENAYHRIQDFIFHYNEKNEKLPLSLSIGFATTQDKKGSISDIFRKAEHNMYDEKIHNGHSAQNTIIYALIESLKEKDFNKDDEKARLYELIVSIAKDIGIKLSEQEYSDLRLLAQFRDIGKVHIDNKILFKEGPLTPSEYSEIKRHSEIGYKLARSIPDLNQIADNILAHHEWWDGSGYPLGLKGEEIPLECRLLSIADAYYAMTNKRPYRKAISAEEAISNLMNGSGTQFDPELVGKFIKILKEKPSKYENLK